MQQALGLARQQALLGIEEGTNVGETLPKDYFQRVVLPRFRAAKTCEQRAAAMAEYFGWARQQALLGTKPEDLPEPPNSGAWLQETERVCVEEAYKKCKNDHDVLAIREVITLQIQFSRMRALLGTAEDSKFEKLENLVEKCMIFELELESDIAHPGLYQTTAKIILPFKMIAVEKLAALLGEGADAPITVEFKSLDECIVKTEPIPVEPTARITKVDGQVLDLKSDDPASRALAAVSGKSKFLELYVHFKPGRVDLQLTPCGDDAPIPPPLPHAWANFSLAFMRDESDPLGGSAQTFVLHFRDWEGEIPGGEVYAQRIYTPQGIFAEEYQGSVKATVRHKPR